MLTVALALLVAVAVLLAILYRQTRSSSFMCGGTSQETSSRSSPDNTYNIYWLNQRQAESITGPLTNPARVYNEKEISFTSGNKIPTVKSTSQNTMGLRRKNANDDKHDRENHNNRLDAGSRFQSRERRRCEEIQQRFAFDMTRLWQQLLSTDCWETSVGTSKTTVTSCLQADALNFR